jgi:hypothetical protein
MQRRQLCAHALSLTLTALCMRQAQALGLSDLGGLSNADASKGLKAALEQGAVAAVNLLGTQDGFLGNEKVKIPLPGFLEDAAKLMRTFGQGQRVDELVTAMNRGAEAAVPIAKDQLTKAIQTMTVTDAKTILTGGTTAVTEFFQTRTRAPLSIKFLPVVTKATEKVGLAAKFNEVAGKAAEMGLLKKEDSNIQKYVTGKTLDGLYFMIGEEEKKIRQNPAAYGSAILTKVFGALK